MTVCIEKDKFVELNYRVLDQKTGSVLIGVEFPLGYVHGRNQVLDQRVMQALEGKSAGEILSVPINGAELYGDRDESLVVTDRIDHVPEEYRELGTRIVMENDKGEPRSFLVTRMDEHTLTIDGNHPLCGRELLFELEVLRVRDATPEEIAAGGALEPGADVGDALTQPISM